MIYTGGSLCDEAAVRTGVGTGTDGEPGVFEESMLFSWTVIFMSLVNGSLSFD